MMVNAKHEMDYLSCLVDAASKVDPLPEKTTASTCIEHESAETRVATRPVAYLPARKRKGSTFPVILMLLLDDPSNSTVLSWLPDGSSFIIVDPNKFAMELMPLTFQIIRFPTFLKRLQQWGFAQIRRPGHAEHGAYRHPDFRRGDLASCRKIQYHSGKSVKSTKSVKADKADIAAVIKASSTMPPMAIVRPLKNPLASGSGLGRRQQQHHLPKDFLSQLQNAQRLTAQAALQKRAASLSRGDDAPILSQDYINEQLQYVKYVSSGDDTPILSQDYINEATKKVVGAALASLRRDKFLEHHRSNEQKNKALSSDLFSLSGAKSVQENAPSSQSMLCSRALPSPSSGLMQQYRPNSANIKKN